MSNKNLELCECLKCKRNGIGKYVHPTTKWKHSKKRKYNIELIDDDIIDESYDEYNSYNEESYREDNTAFKEIVTATVGISSKSIHSLIKMLKDIIPIKPIWVDRCINSCCAFTGDYENLNECIYCKAKRYQVEGQLKAQVAYFSIQDQLVIQYHDLARAKQLRYHSEYISRNIDGTIGDVFDGAQYKNLLQKGYFQDDHDIVLLCSVDGYQLFKQKYNDYWIILFINTNLPPEQRVKKENLLIISIILDPKVPKDFNSFIKPVVDELCLLEGIYNNHIYYPTTLPSNANNTNETYDPSNLPRRMHSDYVTRIGQIVTIELSKTRELLVSNLGVIRRSVLLDIRSTQFPACFLVDIMHLFYENVTPYMLRHWMGSFFKDSTLNNQPYTLSNKQWSEIGANMDAIKNRYKAEEWASWITLYSLPLLKDQLPSVYLKVYSNENYDKEFQWPSKTYDLKKSEIKEIKSHLSVIDNKAAEMKLSDFKTRGIKFGHLITSDGQVIGSEWIRRNKNWVRINYTILDQEKMLANVKWTSNVNEDALGTTFFVGNDGSTQFIDVTAIDRCVRFIKLGHKTYIIDKEYMEE
ncbi:transposase domain-containing protein [Rhizophagus clarus]|uniref:Transposase domain-containing protein n=1 Tax=Rhizophagus clarus TaxID=94130 RepID=A0A8H3LWH7_9GLOM|nr:transposase domain-containing protein [Rhizophagus clarus]